MSARIVSRTDHLTQVEDTLRSQIQQRYASVMQELGEALIRASRHIANAGDPNSEFVDKLKRRLFVELTTDELPYIFADYFAAEADESVEYYGEELDAMAGRLRRHMESVVAQAMEV